jgi:hypothetical protein
MTPHLKWYLLVTFSLVFVEGTTSLEQRLVNPSTTSNNTNSCTCRPRNSFLGTTRKPDSRLVVIRVSNNGGVVPGSAGEGTSITDFLLDVADDGTFGALGDREDITNAEGGLFATVDKGAGVETLGSDESFFAEFVAVGITENDSGERSTTVRIISRWIFKG